MALSISNIIALRNEKGSYNSGSSLCGGVCIIALRNEKGSYNYTNFFIEYVGIIALRNEKGSYPFLRRNKKCGKKQRYYVAVAQSPKID